MLTVLFWKIYIIAFFLNLFLGSFEHLEKLIIGFDFYLIFYSFFYYKLFHLHLTWDKCVESCKSLYFKLFQDIFFAIKFQIYLVVKIFLRIIIKILRDIIRRFYSDVVNQNFIFSTQKIRDQLQIFLRNYFTKKNLKIL